MQWVLPVGALGSLAVAVLMTVIPRLVIPHATFSGSAQKALLVQGIGSAIALLSAVMAGLRYPARSGQLTLLAPPLALATFVFFVAFLGNWIIDDAGITFAYARNLADGYGLVAFPGHAPEEGYSSTLWVLILAGMHLLGLSIPLTAKVLGGLFGAAALTAAFDLVLRDPGAREPPLLGLLLALSMICIAPFVIWSVSGQEHSLEAFILILTLWLIEHREDWRRWITGLLAMLVLIRPEAPLIVATVFAAALADSWVAVGRVQFRRNLPLSLVPFLVFCGLELFRLAYFGDLLPNPYYAKATGAGVLSILNLVGGGWHYLINGLFDTGLMAVVPIIIIAAGRLRDRFMLYASAIISAQLFFILWAHGDWMAQSRFLVPLIPVFAVVGARAFARLDRLTVARGLQTTLAGVVSVLLLVHSADQLATFRRHPTTPFATVRAIGQEFAHLAARLGVQHPILAHHDAGGILYDRSIDLVDLGGLADRAIAKHMHDRAWLVHYLLDEVQPTFFFGADNFATASGYTDTLKFRQEYVPLDFQGLPFMHAYLCAVRRDVVHPTPGIEIVRQDGRIVRVVVHPTP